MARLLMVAGWPGKWDIPPMNAPERALFDELRDLRGQPAYVSTRRLLTDLFPSQMQSVNVALDQADHGAAILQEALSCTG